MAEGRWQFNGDPFRFNGDGTMIDGQHRALAVIDSGKTVKALVIRDLPGVVHPTIDTGSVRNLANELSFRQEPSVTNVAATLRLIYLYESGEILTIATRSSRSGELLKMLDNDHDAILESVRMAQPAYKAAGGRQSTLAAVAYLGSKEHDQDAMQDWLDHLREGTNYDEGDACLAYRNYATNVRTTPRIRVRPIEWFAITIKCVNAYLRGEEVHNLRWRRMGTQAEDFPTIYTAKELKAL